MADLTKSEEELFTSFESNCRRRIRKADRSGVVIEEARADDGFAEDFYNQLKDVFAKHGLVPPYGLDRVNALIRHLYPTGNLLLVRARSAEGTCIATGIFPGFRRVMYGWASASWRQYQHLSPNEAVQWYAMRYWKARGAVVYDMGGGGEWKKSSTLSKSR